MKALKVILALAIATLCFASCGEKTDDTTADNNSVTMKGKTYDKVDAYYRFETERMFILLLDIHSDIEINGSAQVDTRVALGEDLNGNTMTLSEENGYGDRFCFSFYGEKDFDYYLEPVTGTQTTKKIDATHYSIKMDVKDKDGNAFKLDVVANALKEK